MTFFVNSEGKFNLTKMNRLLKTRYIFSDWVKFVENMRNFTIRVHDMVHIKWPLLTWTISLSGHIQKNTCYGHCKQGDKVMWVTL